MICFSLTGRSVNISNKQVMLITLKQVLLSKGWCSKINVVIKDVIYRSDIDVLSVTIIIEYSFHLFFRKNVKLFLVVHINGKEKENYFNFLCFQFNIEGSFRSVIKEITL